MENGPNQILTPAAEKSESYALMKVLRRLAKLWWLILLVAILGGIGGIIYASYQKPVYQSYLSFALDEGGSEPGGSVAMGLAAQLGISLGGAQDVFTGDNIIEIMLSRRMIEGVLLSVDTFDQQPVTLIQFYLKDKNDESNPIPPNLIFYPGEARENFSYAKDSLLYKTYLRLKKNHIIARRPDKRLNIFELMVTSNNEKFSKVFTDKLVDVTNRFYTEIRSKKARETLEILEERVPEMKGKLDASISSKAAIQDANLNTAFARAQVPLLKSQSNSQVYGTAYAEMFKNLEMARFQYLKSIPLMQIIDPANYPMQKIKVGKLKMAILMSFIATAVFVFLFTVIGVVRYRSA